MTTTMAAPGLAGFLTEARSYVSAVRSMLADDAPLTVDRLQEAQSHIDVLSGAAEMLDLPELAALAQPAGALLSTAIAEGGERLPAPRQDALDGLGELLSQIETFITTRIGEDDSPASERPAPPSRSLPSDLPPDLLSIFTMEAQEHCQAIQAGLEAVRGGAGGGATLGEVRRATHTLKGAAASIGFKGIARLAHLMEELLETWIEAGTQPGDAELSLLFDSADALEALMGAGAAGDIDSALEGIDARFAATLGEAYSPPEEAGSPLPIDEASILPQMPRTESILRLPQTSVDSLIKHLGEVLINRSTLEEQITALRQLVTELRHSSSRLQQVALDIDSRVEVMPLIESRRPSKLDPLFDPLELDRYTQLHQSTRELSEITADILDVNTQFQILADDLGGTATRERRLTTELQEGLINTRLVPFREIETRLRRVIQRTASDLGKPTDLTASGLETRIDKSILDTLTDPLMHLLRNAVDHGIEPAAQRAARGKRRAGTVALNVRKEHGRVIVTLSDDGAGIDLERVRRQAAVQGLLTPQETADERRLLDLLFLEGFSTLPVATQTSGRGVGLDIVRRAVSQLHGTIRVDTAPGQGTTFVITLPVTLAITRALFIRSGGQSFAVPLEQIAGVAKLVPDQLEEIEREGVLHHEGKVLTTFRLSSFVTGVRDPQPHEKFALIIEHGAQPAAVLIEGLAGTNEAVVKSLGSHLRYVHGISGATIAGDGRVVLILNLPEIVEGRQARPHAVKPLPAQTTAKPGAHVLVVDDSISVRRVVCSFLERSGWRTTDARDGIEALEKIAEARPDVALVDIEMPRMNGFELLGRIKSNPALRDLPVVFLTSRSAEKHRERAAQLQVDGYLVKPYRDAELLAELTRVIR